MLNDDDLNVQSDPFHVHCVAHLDLSGHRLDGLRHHAVVDLDVDLRVGRSNHRFVAVEHIDDQPTTVPNLEPVDR